VPIAIVQHGLGSWRGDILPVADSLARAGWAAIGFDIDYHGARSRCTSDGDCASGSCTNGTCPGGFVPVPAAMDPLACDLAAISHDPRDCRPLVSGTGYIPAANLFVARSNGQQYVVDAAQLVRVLSDARNGNALAGRLAALGLSPAVDNSKLGFLGHSLGGIDGAVFVSAAPEPRVSVLNVTGGHLFDILSTSPALHAPVDQFLAAIGVMRDTAQYARVVGLADWILDPADPFSVSPSLRARPTIVQQAGMDQVIPTQFQADLAFAIFGALDAQGHAQGKDGQGNFVSTYFPTAQHGDLVAPNAVGVAEQTQAIGFLTSFGALLPPPQ
jgi:hypothetical protein